MPTSSRQASRRARRPPGRADAPTGQKRRLRKQFLFFIFSATQQTATQLTALLTPAPTLLHSRHVPNFAPYCTPTASDRGAPAINLRCGQAWLAWGQLGTCCGSIAGRVSAAVRNGPVGAVGRAKGARRRRARAKHDLVRSGCRWRRQGRLGHPAFQARLGRQAAGADRRQSADQRNIRA